MTARPRPYHICCICFLVSLLTGDATAESALTDWSGFQNGGRLQTDSPETLQLPDAKAAPKWRVDLAGYGQSSPVKFGDQLYVTFISGKTKQNLHVAAVDWDSGKVRWQHDAPSSAPEKNTNYVSRAAPSPVCDALGVIAFFESGNLIALTPAGELRWQRDFTAEFEAIKTRHGLGGSLEHNERLVFVWVERDEKPYVLALDKQTGETVWRADGLGTTSWSTPRLVPLADGTAHLVLSGIGQLVGLDPNDGKRLWEFDQIAGNSTPTPVPVGDGRFLIGATSGRGGKNKGAAKSNGLIQIQGSAATGFKAEYLWQAKRATSSFGSPIACQGRAYFVNRAGVTYCLDLETGEELYAKRTASAVWATPVACPAGLLLFGKDGTTTLLAAGEKFQTLGAFAVWADERADQDPERQGDVMYSGALINGSLLLRGGDRVYRFEGQ